jgi:hypothetical protein
MNYNERKIPVALIFTCGVAEPEFSQIGYDKIFDVYKTAVEKKFDVSFGINIVPKIYNEETPSIVFNKEIIEFCYLIGAEIAIDLYVYDKE